MVSLEGITRRGSVPLRNPGKHSSLCCYNRLIVEKMSPGKDGLPYLAQRVVGPRNIMCTFGLDRLVNLIATGTQAFSALNTAGWVAAMVIGTDNTAPVSTNTALGASTAIVQISAASGNKSDAGARTLEYQGTFDDGLSYIMKEGGLHATSVGAGSMVAHSTLAATDEVNKGTADTINVSHQIIMDTK